MKRLLFILFIVVGWNPLLVRAQDIIETIANKDTSAGYNGDNILAVDAKLWFPEAVCFDKTGNLLIADVANNRIRKINANGIISTIAGKDTMGYSGDNGPATNAGLYFPVDVFVDTAGDIYIADGLDNRIRKIAFATGIITTVAGSGIAGYSGDNGPATDAQLDGPSGIYVNGNHDIYFADYYNNVVRKVDGTTGIITTFAGNGLIGYTGGGGPATDAALNGATKVCLDSANNLFFSDQYNNVVRRVDASSGIITTFAGNGTVGYSGDSGVAKHAQLNRPGGLFFDKQYNLYITEFGNGVVRRVDGMTGIITTVAGNGTWGYSGDGGPPLNAQMVPADAIFSSNGDMIIADYNNHCIRRIHNSISVKAPMSASEYSIYPNPTSGKFVIKTTRSTQYMVEVCSVLGEKVFQGEFNGGSGEVDLTREANGVYFVYLTSGGERVVERVVAER